MEGFVRDTKKEGVAIIATGGDETEQEVTRLYVYSMHMQHNV